MAKRRRKSKKWISWLVFLVLIVVAGVVCYFVWDGYFRDKGEENEQSYSPSQIEETEEREEVVVTEQVEEEPTIVEEVEEKKVVQYEGSNPNESNSITGAVTYAGASNGVLMIRVNIDQFLSSGKCRLSLSRGGTEIYSDEAGIINSASTATCEGFNVSASAVGSGKIDIAIKIEAEGKTGTIKGEVNL